MQTWIITCPIAMCGTTHVSARFTEWQKYILEAFLVISPALGPQNHRSLRPVGNDEAVSSVMKLAPVAAILETQPLILFQKYLAASCIYLVKVTDKLPGRRTIRRVLKVMQPLLNEFA